MATTPGRKVRDGKSKGGHHAFDETPPYFGDAETFTSGSANADAHVPISHRASVEGGAREADMCDMPGKRFAYIPERGNQEPAEDPRLRQAGQQLQDQARLQQAGRELGERVEREKRLKEAGKQIEESRKKGTWKGPQ